MIVVFMNSKKLSFDNSKGQQLWLPCAKCHGKTCHNVLASVNGSESVEYVIDGITYENAFWYDETYQIVQCEGCKSISFRSDYDDSDQPDDDDPGGRADNEKLYPSRVEGRHRLDKSSLLPLKVRRVYFETHSALCSRLPILAGIGIRALIEAICTEKKARGKDLKAKIDNLVDIGLLTNAGAEILHSLRILGNRAAHEVEPHSELALGSAMDVVEHLLIGVYILPKEAENLPKQSKSII